MLRSMSSSRPASYISVPLETSETLNLHPAVIDGQEFREDLRIEPLDNFALGLVKTTYRDPRKIEPRTIDFRVHAVLLRYAVSDRQNPRDKWMVAVNYGILSRVEVVEYPLVDEDGAFAFQRLVTTYSPHSRFAGVKGSALAQHDWKSATEIDFEGELQLWKPARPSRLPNDRLSSIPSPTRTHSSTETLHRPLIHRATSHGAVIQTDPKGRNVALTITRPPPLLVVFAKYRGNDGTVVYEMIKIDITNVECQLLQGKPNALELVHVKANKKFSICRRQMRNELAWNLCHLRPGISHAEWSEERCKSLTLNFTEAAHVMSFWESQIKVRAFAKGIEPTQPRSPSSFISPSFTEPRPPNNQYADSISNSNSDRAEEPPTREEVSDSVSSEANNRAAGDGSMSFAQWPLAAGGAGGTGLAQPEPDDTPSTEYVTSAGSVRQEETVASFSRRMDSASIRSMQLARQSWFLESTYQGPPGSARAPLKRRLTNLLSRHVV